MLFNSYEFILLFLPIVWCLYTFAPHKRAKLFILGLSSYFFYGYWNYKFIPLLLFSTIIDYWMGIAIDKSSSPRSKKNLLFVSLAVNLGVLGFFKYFNFFATFFMAMAGQSFSAWDIVLPVGISFYTFQSMSYTIDIYRGNQKPYRDFLAFSTYISFFPQLVAGPIVRHDELVPQFINPQKSADWNEVAYGVQRFILGLAKKVIIADIIGNAVDAALIHIDQLSTLEAWMCALGYTFQLYFDFSGYSDMAIGLGKMFGFTFPENFNSPYKSKSITEFWRRWHMTLSFWLRDYLYISLGGNRSGRYRTYINLVLTMLLGGLWHGANWTFVLWGGVHGSVLAIERYFKGRVSLPIFVKRLCTLTIIVSAWVIFRSPNLEFAFTWLNKLLSLEGGFYYQNFDSKLRDKYAIALVLAIVISFFKKNTSQINYKEFLSKKYLAFFVIVLTYILLDLGEKSPFLYFQF